MTVRKLGPAGEFGLLKSNDSWGLERHSSVAECLLSMHQSPQQITLDKITLVLITFLFCDKILFLEEGRKVYFSFQFKGLIHRDKEVEAGAGSSWSCHTHSQGTEEDECTLLLISAYTVQDLSLGMATPAGASLPTSTSEVKISLPQTCLEGLIPAGSKVCLGINSTLHSFKCCVYSLKISKWIQCIFTPPPHYIPPALPWTSYISSGWCSPP